jgi:hypothetical protein
MKVRAKAGEDGARSAGGQLLALGWSRLWVSGDSEAPEPANEEARVVGETLNMETI